MSIDLNTLNKRNKKRPLHIYDDGGWRKNWGSVADDGTFTWDSTKAIGSALGMASAAASIGTSAYKMANPDTDSVEDRVDAQVDAMQRQRDIGQFNSLDALMSGWSSNRNIDTSYNTEDYYNGPSNGSIWSNALSSAVQGATAGLAAGPLGGLAGGIVGLGAGLVGGYLGKSKAEKAASEATARLEKEANETNNYRQSAYKTMAQNMTAANNRNIFSQVAAYGGPLGISLNPVYGAIDYMQNEELLDQMSDNMSRNSRKTSMPMFAFGGALGGYGGDWTNGLTFIKAGGTHGQNPLGGVPAGIAQDGNPNLVEEGEVIWNDYVFSNRLKVPKTIAEKYKFGGKSDLTFAQAVEKIQKNSSERPNDPIEKRGLEAALAELMGEQEMIRQRKAEREYQEGLDEAAAYAADGGSIHIAKNKKGTFTAAATKHGMGVQEFAGHVLANKDKYSSAMVKKANFARNASKWNHALGGHLFWPGGDLGMNKRMYYHDYMPPMEDANTFVPGSVPFMLGFSMPEPQTSLLSNNSMFRNTDRFGMDYMPFTYTGNTSTNISSIGSQSSTVDNTVTDKNKNPLPTSGWQTKLRYIPAFGAALSLGHMLANKPDYSYANELDEAGKAYAEAIGNSGRVTPKFLGDYLAYNPFDRLFYANELGAQTAATRSAIRNQSNNNAGQVMAGLLAAGYNDAIGLGKLYREGEEYNRAQRERVAEFNRGTNQFNSSMDMRAQEINARANMAKAEALLNNKYRVLGMKQAIDDQRDQNLSLALTNLFNNVGGIGEDYAQRYWLNALINSGVFGTPNEDMLNIAACGGKISRKKKKGITI